MKAVRHPDPDVRAAAIEALGLLPGTRDTAMLLADREPHDPDLGEPGEDVAREMVVAVPFGSKWPWHLLLDETAQRIPQLGEMFGLGEVHRIALTDP